MRNLTLVFAIFFFSNCYNAQEDSFRIKYNKEVIILVQDNKFILNGEKLSRRKIRPLLEKYPDAAKEYKLFQKNRRITNGLLIGSGGLYIASLFVLNSSVDAGVVTFLTAFGVGISASPFATKAHEHLLQAVFNYNREVLAGP